MAPDPRTGEVGSGWVSRENWADRGELSQGCCRLLPWFKARWGPPFPAVGEQVAVSRARQPVHSLPGWESSCLVLSDPSPQPQPAVSIAPLTRLPQTCPGRTGQFLCSVCCREHPPYGASAPAALMASTPLPGAFMYSLHKHAQSVCLLCVGHRVPAQTQTGTTVSPTLCLTAPPKTLF